MKTVKNTAKTVGRKAVTKAIAKQDSEQQQKTALSQEQINDAIRLKAYELYVQRGCTQGNEVEDWLAAEQLVIASSN